jgi:hypothetical protein
MASLAGFVRMSSGVTAHGVFWSGATSPVAYRVAYVAMPRCTCMGVLLVGKPRCSL